MNYNENGATKTMIEWIIPLSLIGLIIFGIQLKDYKYPSQIQKELIKEFNKEWEQIKMTENEFEYNKRFTYHRADGFEDNGKYITPYDAVYILNELNDENQHIKNTIQTAYQNERTKLGKSVLKQLLEAIQ